MRLNRLESINRRGHILVVKMLLIFYCICFALIYLTSGTKAQFTNTSVHKQVIQAGEWWDGSSLSFNGMDDQIIHSCGSVELAVDIKNDSKQAMYGVSEYEIYQASFSEDNSLEIGNSISDELLEIDIIEANKTSNLSYTVSAPGDYIFKAYQRPGYDHNEVERTSILSEVLTVICLEEEVELVEGKGNTLTE